jgi:hypothetical protein
MANQTDADTNEAWYFANRPFFVTFRAVLESLFG